MYKLLDAALDCGITEYEFWNMTVSQIDRKFQSVIRVDKRKAEEQASYDYILGDLIGKSVARIYNKSCHYPEIYDAYPHLFDSKEIEDKRKEQLTELSALRFKQFANFHNEKLGGGKKS